MTDLVTDRLPAPSGLTGADVLAALVVPLRALVIPARERLIAQVENEQHGAFAPFFDQPLLKALLVPMLARKEELKALAESEGLPPAQPVVVNPNAG